MNNTSIADAIYAGLCSGFGIAPRDRTKPASTDRSSRVGRRRMYEPRPSVETQPQVLIHQDNPTTFRSELSSGKTLIRSRRRDLVRLLQKLGFRTVDACLVSE